ncbi:TetR/AcrR family transcriptional regulator [Szabonella alba]|uniref:TetR family transcriptional regulator n=1 Tax=Szabonella alba TaxID=2804194 RepID=A0A8K0XZJ1_9RHOB|nr:TetR/AcrR family transcriptional regulator [Szabonella alba]MBL4917175.1 TetR family transcriptional regulator [Szabonella alba]
MARKTGSHSEITGPKIRAAAQRLFAQDGFAAVSMRRIAAEVGVQAGALYLYTPDKQALLFDMMTAHLGELLEAAAALPAAPDPVARLDRFARFHIAHHLERPEAVFIAYMELRNLTPENFAAVEEMRRRYEQMLQAILSDGKAQGLFRIGDAKLTTLALIAMMNGVTTWYREGGRLSRSEVAAHYADMALRAVRA